MSRILLSLLVLTAGFQTCAARLLPTFPQQAHVASAEEVKAYWTRTLRWKCRTLRNRSAITVKKRLIEAIERGLYDDTAEIVALRSNIEFYEFHQRFIASQRAKERIADIYRSQAEVAAARPVAPVPPAVQPVVAGVPLQQETEVVYYEEEEWIDVDCPPHQPRAESHRPHLPQRPPPDRPIVRPPAPRPTPTAEPSKRAYNPPPTRLVPQSAQQSSKPAPPSSRPVSRPSPAPAPQSPSRSKQAFPMRR